MLKIKLSAFFKERKRATMQTEKINETVQILTEHLKNNQNILILGEGYLTGKTSLINEIIANSENKENILFISRMNELHIKNRGINHIVADSDQYSKIDYETIEKQGYEAVFIDDIENFIIDEKGKIEIPHELANLIVELTKERKLNFVFSFDRAKKEDIKSILHFFDELNQKQYKKKAVDVAAVLSKNIKQEHSFKIIEL
jgi:hypothetical protein